MPKKNYYSPPQSSENDDPLTPEQLALIDKIENVMDWLDAFYDLPPMKQKSLVMAFLSRRTMLPYEADIILRRLNLKGE